jgi:transcriptional regulator with XRE-family HTH domain
MGNERLRSSVAAAGLTYAAVAEHIGVDPKTIERWVINGRRPHRNHRWAAARLLSVDEAYLWPSTVTDSHTHAAAGPEFVGIYPTRGAVPIDLWRRLIEDAAASFDFLAFAGLFLPDYNPDFAEILINKAAAGVRVRILLGDPEGGAIAVRGAEEGIGRGLAERARIVLSHLRRLEDAPGAEIRLHNTTLYASMFRCDETMLVNTHIYGSPAAANPVLHLHRVTGGRMFDQYQASFDTVWHSATVHHPSTQEVTGGESRLLQ